MQAIILVGGEGTRLRPLTVHRLKTMVPMVNRQFLEYQLYWLKQYGITEVVLSICHMPQLIRKTFGDGKRYGVKLHYAEETLPLGTAGAIKHAESFVSGNAPVVVVNGDILTNLNLKKMLAWHNKQRARATLALTLVADPSAYGLIKYDAQQRISSFVEKPSSDEGHSPWVNAGVYIFNPEVFAAIPTGKPYSAERGLFPRLLTEGERVWGFANHDYWMDIGTVERYWQAHMDILEGRMFMLPAGPSRRNYRRTWLGKSCRLHRSVRLGPNVVLGEEGMVAREVRLGESVSIGQRVVINEYAVLERSVIWDDVMVGEGAQLNGCTVGSGTRIGRYVQMRPGVVLGENSHVPDYSRL